MNERLSAYRHDGAGNSILCDYKRYDQRGLGDGSIVVAQWDPAKGTWVQVSAPKGEKL
jgi:hypothetical protein